MPMSTYLVNEFKKLMRQVSMHVFPSVFALVKAAKKIFPESRHILYIHIHIHIYTVYLVIVSFMYIVH